MNKLKSYLISGAIVIILGLGFWAGWKSHSALQPCPTITVDTIEVYDPYWHHIADSLAGLPPKEVIKWLPQDTLYIPGDSVLVNVDTAAILKDYFSVYKYQWEKLDSGLLQVNLETTVTKNKPIKYDLKYKILRPQSVIINNIDNSVLYNSYIMAGVDIPFKNINYITLELFYIFPKGYIKTLYTPELESFGVGVGATIIKFKQKK